LRNNCADYLKNEREGKIRVNENNRVVHVATGMEFPLMIGNGEKVMESPVTLKFRELLAVSPGVTMFVDDQSGRQRLPIDSVLHGITSANASATYFDPSTNSTSGHLYHACPSSRAKAILDGWCPKVESWLPLSKEVRISGVSHRKTKRLIFWKGQ